MATTGTPIFSASSNGSYGGPLQPSLIAWSASSNLFEVHGEKRFAIESSRRPQIEELSHPDRGRAAIRDNKPLREQFLAGCLDDCTPQQWYELLNRKVFFWVSRERLETLLAARAYRNRAHDVLTIDTRRLLERQGDDVTLAPINTGATLYPSAPRQGLSTFRSIEDYDWDVMRRWRGLRDAVVELTVDYSVSEVEYIATRVERRAPGEPPRVVWHPV